MIYWDHSSAQPKRHLDRFSRFYTDDRRMSLYFTMGCPFPPQNCPFPWGHLDRQLIHGSLGRHESSTKRHLDRFGRFCRAHYCDRPTDRPRYSVGNNRPAMRSNNNAKWPGLILSSSTTGLLTEGRAFQRFIADAIRSKYQIHKITTITTRLMDSRMTRYQKNIHLLTPRLSGYYTAPLTNFIHFLRFTASSLSGLTIFFYNPTPTFLSKMP